MNAKPRRASTLATCARYGRRVAVLVGVCLSLVACSSYPPGPALVGSHPQATLAALGAPTARHRLPQGERLEYATGPQGRETWMIDVASGADGQPRIAAVAQVLTDANLQRWQTRLAAEPVSSAELLAAIGRPAQMRPGNRLEGQVWSWRYATFDCLWFQVLVDARGMAHSAAFGPDPACDVRDDRDS